MIPGNDGAGTRTGLARWRGGIVPALVLVVLAIFAVLALQNRVARKAAADQEADRVTFIVAQGMRATLDRQAGILDAMLAASGGTDGDAAGLARVLRVVPLLAPSIRAAAILDSNGAIVARAPGAASQGAILPAVAALAYRAALDHPDEATHMTRAVRDAALGGDVVGLARARHDAAGHLAGLALLVVDPAHFDGLKRLLLLRTRSRLAILRENGVPLLQFPQDGRAASDQSPGARAETRAIESFDPRAVAGSFRSPATAGLPSDLDIHYRAIPGFPLVVSYMRRQTDIARPWRETWIANGLLVGVAIAAFLLLGASLARKDRRERARDDARQAREAVALRENVAELAAAAVRADEANRAKSRFFAHVTHELRTPLNAILGFSEVIRGEIFGPVANPRYCEYAGLIHDSGAHLLSLINDLLDLAKLEAGKMEIAPIALPASTLARSTLDLVELLARERQIALSASGLESCPVLLVDPRAAKQILVNLLSNAIKFTAAGGRIELGFRGRAEGGVAITVSDTGIGMSPEEIRTAFEPFGQVPSDLARRDKGSGLGLPIARTLVRLHGGELSVASEPGRGTTVTILLPSQPAPSPGAARQQRAVVQGGRAARAA